MKSCLLISIVSLGSLVYLLFLFLVISCLSLADLLFISCLSLLFLSLSSLSFLSLISLVSLSFLLFSRIQMARDVRAETVRVIDEVLDADLLVCGHRGLGSVQRLLVGSYSEFLSKFSPVPVLIYKPPRKNETE